MSLINVKRTLETAEGTLENLVKEPKLLLEFLEEYPQEARELIDSIMGKAATLCRSSNKKSQYWIGKEEKNGLANACIAIFSINMALQLGIVYANGKKRGATLLAREGLYVLSGIKPAVDAYRVVSGAKGDADSLLNPMVELTISKIVEM